jgi:hypothetical protein
MEDGVHEGRAEKPFFLIVDIVERPGEPKVFIAQQIY